MVLVWLCETDIWGNRKIVICYRYPMLIGYRHLSSLHKNKNLDRHWERW